MPFPAGIVVYVPSVVFLRMKAVRFMLSSDKIFCVTFRLCHDWLFLFHSQFRSGIFKTLALSENFTLNLRGLCVREFVSCRAEGMNLETLYDVQSFRDGYFGFSAKTQPH